MPRTRPKSFWPYESTLTVSRPHLSPGESPGLETEMGNWNQLGSKHGRAKCAGLHGTDVGQRSGVSLKRWRLVETLQGRLARPVSSIRLRTHTQQPCLYALELDVKFRVQAVPTQVTRGNLVLCSHVDVVKMLLDKGARTGMSPGLRGAQR